MKKVIITLLFLTILISSLTILKQPTVQGNQNTIVCVEPAEIKDIPPAQNFTVNIKIENVVDLYGFDVQLKWDPTILHCVSWELHVPVEDYPDGVLHQTVLVIKNMVDESDNISGAEAGTMGWWAATSMAPAEAFNGNGTIATLTFQVVGWGSSGIIFVYTMLSDVNGAPIAHTTQDGYFVNYVPPPPPPATIAVNPQKIVDPTLTPCNNFSVNIDVEDVTNLYSFDFWLNFNNTVIEASNVTVSEQFPPEQTTKEILNGEGKVHISSTLISPQAPINGNVTLATVKFHVLGTGESVLDLDNVQLKNDQNENITINEPVDGYFNNILVAVIAVSPEELIDPSLTPGSFFSINITLQNAIDMYGYTINLHYDTNVLTCLGADIIPPNNETHFITQQSINDLEGLVSVGVQYYAPAEPLSIYENKTVTILRFQVQSYGQTALDLFNTSLVDINGKEIFHEEIDGFFATLIRDVAIIGIKVSQNMTYLGREVTINVTAMNKGNMTTESFNITLYYNNSIIDTKNVTLDPWTNTTITFVWNTTGLTPCNNYTIHAEAEPVPYEIDLSNNILYDGWIKIKMIGDLNGDDKVDILDISLACASYEAHEGDENWNSEADLAMPYGVIDIFDIVTIASRYGMSCP